MMQPFPNALGMVARTAAVTAVAVALACSAHAGCPDSARDYWTGFRSAALSGKPSAVAELSAFPFEIRGTLDESKREHVDRAQFERRLPALLREDPGLSREPSTMRVLVKSTSRLPDASCNPQGSQFRVGSWVFRLTPDGWRFVQAFVED